MTQLTTPLDGPWEVAQRFPAGHHITFPDGGERDWLPATVPGHVHPDLVRAGVIPDPFWRQSEWGVAWVDEADWTYRTTFTVDADRLASRGAHGRHFLQFGGLDTLARVYLNDTLVGTSENFFVPLRVDVTGALREGDNAVRVEFDSALRAGRDRAAAYLGDGTSERGAGSYFNFGPRAFVRKPQYMFGWDWGPELVSCGIWQGVELVTVPVAEIVDWRYEYDFADPLTVAIRLQITVEKYDPRPLTVGVALYAPGDNTPEAALPDAPGRYTADLLIPDQKVARWNPNGSEFRAEGRGPRAKGGPQKRYLLNLRVWETPAPDAHEDDPKVFVAHKGVSVGFRTIELIRTPDADGAGEAFGFRVNGVDTFIKGANWIPDGCFPGNITPTRLRERLTQARDAGFNMLRVWGGGLYETNAFYDLCDELGLMVWQDFAFACSMYPDDLPPFVESVRREAVANVRRLRHHPCLALWCGGNENLELAQGRWAGPTQAMRFFGDTLIHQTLPDVLQTEDARTPYWPNSPYGGPVAQGEEFGDSHYWNVWHSKKPGSDGDWRNYAQSRSRFSSEFGFAAPAGARAWDGCMTPDDKAVNSPVSRWHDKTRKGYETYLGFIGKHYPALATWDDLLYYGQANQADALQFGVEHYRRHKGHCAGTLFWQLNDCWPTHSWSVIDSAGEPKAAYYASRRFYAPLLLSLFRDGNRITAHLVNDDPDEVVGRVVLRLLTVDGAEIARAEAETVAPANAATPPDAPVAALDVSQAGADSFVHGQFLAANGTVLAENFALVAEPKALTALPGPGIGWTLDGPQSGQATFTVIAARLAWYVRLGFEGLPDGAAPTFSDNWFHLAPGQTRTVQIAGLPPDLIGEALRPHFRIRYM